MTSSYLSMYRAYHSELKIQFAQKSIAPKLLKPIPRSTKQRWKNKSVHSFWTPYPIDSHSNPDLLILRLKAENLHLKKKVKALFCLVQVYRILIRAFEIKAQHAQAIKQNMIQLSRFCEQEHLGKTIWRYLPFSRKQWNAWTKQPDCPASLQKLCRKTYTQQLTIKEHSIIKTTADHNQYKHWPLCSMYYLLLRQKRLSCSISTFYKYCRLLSIIRKRQKYPKQYTPIRAEKPLKILHQDITIFKTMDGAKHYIYVIRDNFSRAILACKAASVYNSDLAKQVLQEVMEKFDLLNEEGALITDDGMENKGKMEEYLQQPGMAWKKIIAQLDIIQSNSMVEAANKIIKYRFLYRQPVADAYALHSLLIKAQLDFNTMPNAQLSGYTPNEVLGGATPDYYRFSNQINSAKKIRMMINSSFDCEQLCQT